MTAPKCPVCKVRDRAWDDEPPGPGSYYARCETCSLLTGYRDHSHTERPNEAQVRAGTYPAGHSWRTAQIMEPIWENEKHVGFRCADHDPCGFEERFTAEEQESCPIHAPTIKGVCYDHWAHRFERGECDEKGNITEFGRQERRRRSDLSVTEG